MKIRGRISNVLVTAGEENNNKNYNNSNGDNLLFKTLLKAVEIVATDNKCATCYILKKEIKKVVASDLNYNLIDLDDGDIKVYTKLLISE